MTRNLYLDEIDWNLYLDEMRWIEQLKKKGKFLVRKN